MLLQSVIDYCQKKRWFDSVSLAKHFKRDLSAIEGLLLTLEYKEVIKELKGICGGGCSSCSSGCSSLAVPTKRYLFIRTI